MWSACRGVRKVSRFHIACRYPLEDRHRENELARPINISYPLCLAAPILILPDMRRVAVVAGMETRPHMSLKRGFLVCSIDITSPVSVQNPSHKVMYTP